MFTKKLPLLCLLLTLSSPALGEEPAPSSPPPTAESSEPIPPAENSADLPEAKSPEPEKAPAPPENKAVPAEIAPVAAPAKNEAPLDIPSRKDWWVFFKPGFVVNADTSYHVTGNPGGYNDFADETGLGGGFLGADFTYQPDFPLGISAAIETNQIVYRLARPGYELAFTAMLIPRLQFHLGDSVLWAGFGVGYMQTVLLFNSFRTIEFNSGVATTLDVTFDRSAISLALSPRIGLDIAISPRFMLGGEVQYTTTKGSLGGQTINYNSGQRTSFTEDFTRKWLAFALRLGITL